MSAAPASGRRPVVTVHQYRPAWESLCRTPTSPTVCRRLRRRPPGPVNRIFARETGQPLERIEEDTHRNFWLGAEAALRYGLVGRIIERVDDQEG